MSERSIIDALCTYIDEMCDIAVAESTGFLSQSGISELKTVVRRNLDKQLRELAERENQLAHSPADPHGAEIDTIDLHPMDHDRVRRSPNVDAAD